MIPCIDTYRCVDLRTVSFDVPPQEVRITQQQYFFMFRILFPVRNFILKNIAQKKILSRDSVTVSVDAVVYFNVIDAEQALCSVDDFRSGSRAFGALFLILAHFRRFFFFLETRARHD